MKLNKRQILHIAELLGNFGLLSLAALVLPNFTGVTLDPSIVIAGIIISVFSITISIFFLRK